MTTVRVLATHEVVQHLFPRPPRTEEDERGLIAGRLIDSALTQCNHQLRAGRKPTAQALLATAAAAYDEEIRDADLPESAEERTRALDQVAGVLKAFRASPIFGLPRPRSRWILIQGEVGLFAQPDFWDGRTRFYEMKSYRPDPLPPDVAMQVRCFQLAFPNFEAYVIGFDRHHLPVATTVRKVAPPTDEEATAALRVALEVGRQRGVPKVVEYLGPPAASYRLPEARAAAGVEAAPRGGADERSAPD